MSRWGKNIVVPLDSLCKEKENTNRPTVARSVGTVGKWGKMGFTSTRTYALAALPATLTAPSPGESPSSVLDFDMSPSVPDPPKPKKFFKSVNTTTPEVMAQIIQHLPRVVPNSPTHEFQTHTSQPSPKVARAAADAIKIKIPKKIATERKKKPVAEKSPKPAKAAPLAPSTKSVASDEPMSDTSTENQSVRVVEVKCTSKKKKELKPEAAPSRVLGRARKTVNYCEEDFEERAIISSLKDIVLPKSTNEHSPIESLEKTSPIMSPSVGTTASANSLNIASKAPEHKPIVLRISKGTSRLVDTDNDDDIVTPSPPHNNSSSNISTDLAANSSGSYIEESSTRPLDDTPQTLLDGKVDLPTPVAVPTLLGDFVDNANEINYSSVKISPDKPPKERLKLIIKGDVIRNAMAAAAASAATNKESINLIENSKINNNNNNNNSSSSADIVKDNQQQQVLQRADKEKKKGKHKHKSKQLQPSATTLIPQICEFKAPSPNVISSSGHGHGNGEIILTPARTVTSPAVLSERDFDSQSSVLGSISSKGNSTPQLTVHASALPEECYVVHSRGSSVITSDLETSQHSSLVAPPSDIELRLESMMMDGNDTGGGVGGCVSQSSTRITVEEPLEEDILSVLRGDGDDDIVEPLTNGKTGNVNVQPRGKRGRGRAANKREDVKEVEKMKTKRLRSKQIEPVEDDKTTALSSTPPPTINRRGRAAKKFETINAKETLDEDLLAPSNTTETTITTTNIITPPPDTKETVSVVTRRGRPARSTRNNTCNYNNNNNNNNNSNNNNSNINKIAANLCAKAEAQNIETTITTTSNPTVTSAASTQRSYGRKRKNQQVTQVLQPPTAEELEEQPNSAKMPAMSHDNYQKPTTVGTKMAPSTNNPNISYNNNNNNNSSSPPRHDYKVKDKFKRTIMLDNNPGSCDAVISMTNYEQQQQQHDSGGEDLEQQQQQRASVKLVISKKKGSIFKSRTLVPADQNTEVSKRHLYKHRWDHDAGGDSTRDVGHDLDDKSASGNVNSKTANAASEIYDDIDENSHANVDGNGGNTCHVMETNATSGSCIGNNSSNNNSSNNNNSASANSSYDMDIDELSRHSGSNASVDNGDTCGGSHKRKDFYTVVRNVKTAHQIQEIGEYQEMNDDVQYILDALQPHNPMSTRILSAMQLASKCMSTAFRMHVRSHDVVTKFFKALSDANNNLSLGLCTSAVMYILSQEGLNMDLDRDSLELMMNLLEAENVADPAEYATYERNQLKIREFCEEIKAQGKATHLNVDTITVGTLAMETLLSLTSKRAGDWFKEELRELGGLEHIIKTITECCRPVIRLFEVMPAITWTGALLDSMRTVERCMRVMENVTQMNEENQKYILKYDNGAMVHTLATLYKLCERELLRHPTTEFTDKENTGVVLRELLMPLMKVLINLTHSFRKNSTPGAEVLGERIDVFDTSFQLLLKTSNYIPERLIFENNILVLLLLINLTMYSKINRTRVIQAQTSTPNHDGTQESTVSAVQAIMQYFYKCEELARLVEKNTDAMLDNTDKDKKKQEEVDETVNNLIQKAGHHMEHTLKGSYAGIFIGHIISDNEDNEMIVRRYLHGNGFKEIITVLEKYYTFMNLTASSDAFTVAHIKSTKELIDYYKRRDLIYAEIGDDNLPLNLDTSCSSTTYDTNNATTSSDAASTRTGSQRVYKTYSSTR